MWIAMTMTAVILVFCITLIVSTFAFHDHHHRKVFVGSVGLGTCITMYGSPLMAVVSLPANGMHGFCVHFFTLYVQRTV